MAYSRRMWVGFFRNHPYHWRARAVDSTGLVSGWVEFDPAPAWDFFSTTPPPDPTGDRGINYCSMGAGGTGWLAGCFLASLLLLFRGFRRR
jgi:hypothetical protein